MDELASLARGGCLLNRGVEIHSGSSNLPSSVRRSIMTESEYTERMSTVFEKMDRQMDGHDISQESRFLISLLSQVGDEVRVKVLKDLEYTYCVGCGKSQIYNGNHNWCQCRNDT